jgi:predicted enzyme related to lactoylglutathione lyase
VPNPFAHVELSTDDVKKAKKFYAAVFAWKLDDLPAMAYTMIDVSGGVGGGMQKKPAPDHPTAWLPYVQVDDVKATMAKALKAGGKAVLEYQEIGDMGSIGIFADPQGATLGLWAAKVTAAVESATTASPPKKAAKKSAAKPAAPANKQPAKKAPGKKAAAAAAPTPSAPAKKASKKAAPPPQAPSKKTPSKKR